MTPRPRRRIPPKTLEVQVRELRNEVKKITLAVEHLEESAMLWPCWPCSPSRRTVKPSTVYICKRAKQRKR